VVDASAATVHGPHPVQKSGTVTVPRELLREVGLDFGDRVHWILNPDLPGTLVLVPSAMLERAMPGLVDALRGSAL
jgi:hypothetical protein